MASDDREQRIAEARKLMREFQDPHLVKPFSVKDPLTQSGQVWNFGTEMVISAGFPEFKGCSFSDTEIREHMGCEQLTLTQYEALIFLATAFWRGENLTGVPKESITAADRFTRNKLHQAFSGKAEIRGAHEYQNGLWVSDIVYFTGDLEGELLDVECVAMPTVSRAGPSLQYSHQGGIKAKLPSIQGYAKLTERGYLDPRTGFPYEVVKSTEPGQAFVLKGEELIKACAEQRYGSEPQVQERLQKQRFPYDGVCVWAQELTHMTKPFQHIENSDLGELMMLMIPELRLAKADPSDTIPKISDPPDPKDNPMAVMLGIDHEFGNLLKITLDRNNIAQCGIAAAICSSSPDILAEYR